MEIKRGIPASPGVAIAQTFLVDTEGVAILKRYVSPDLAEDELSKFERALADAEREILREREKVAARVPAEYLLIFDAHIRMMRDRNLQEEVRQLIRAKHFSSAYALSWVLRKYKRLFRDSEYLQRSLADIEDMERRIMRNILGRNQQALHGLSQEVIVLARELTPSQTVALDRSKVVAFATDAGGSTSHAAILARALEIPAVVGLGSITSEVSGGELIIVDGYQGLVILNPDEHTLESYHHRKEMAGIFHRSLDELRDLPAETRDGTRAELMANIEFPDEIATARSYGASGVGLYRTEFLYLSASGPPTEEDHFEAYRKATTDLGDKPVVIRTMDLAGDKFFGSDHTQVERNPFLGRRSIRLSFDHPEVFKTQLRAILRASALGRVKILFPMISCVDELRRAKRMLSEVMTELSGRGISYNPDIETGIMIEVPSAALTADILARECDFFSVGTNDLIQYTLAIDRMNERVASLYLPTHESILRLLSGVIQAGAEMGIEVAMCGEMAGDLRYTILLLGMGLRVFSLSPYLIPEVKKVMRAVTLREAIEMSRVAMSLNDPAKTDEFLREKTRKILPEAF